MAIMAPTPDQAFMGMMQRSSASSLPLPYSGDSEVSDVGSILEVPSAHGRWAAAAVPGFGRYWSRSSWSSCLVDNSHLGTVPGQQQQLSPPQSVTIGMAQAFCSPAVDQFASFRAGKYNVPGGGEMEPFSLGKSPLCEPASGCASVSTVQQPLLEAVEGVTEASTMVEAAAATIAAATHGHVQGTAMSQENNNSSCSEHHPGGRGGGASPGAHSPARSPSHDSHPGSRKRKKGLSPPDPKGGEGESGKPKSGRGDGGEGKRGAGERSSSEASTESGSPKAPRDSCKGKPQPSRPKEYSTQDYIHVRARRGQATDSHSLAERVRREKISERMKFLQDLVPGCKKVTGKAVMLDEIINYVQSLQRQVEHLSMKLASVNPAQQQPGLTLESMVSNKEMLQTHLSSILGSSSSSNNADAPGALDVVQMGLSQQAGRRLVSGGPCGFDFRSLGHAGLDAVSSRHTMSPPVASLADHMTMAQCSFDNNISQPTGWDGELQSVVQMGFSHQGRLGAFAGLHGQLSVGHMKVEF